MKLNWRLTDKAARLLMSDEDLARIELYKRAIESGADLLSECIEGDQVLVDGVITTTTLIPAPQDMRGNPVGRVREEAVLSDGTSRVVLVFEGRPMLLAGMRLRVRGVLQAVPVTAKSYGRVAIIEPEIEHLVAPATDEGP